MNKKWILATILIILFLISSITTYKIIKNHNDHLLEVSEKYIIEQAKKCFNEKKCSGVLVTLDNLYQNGYLINQVNPVTKKIYNPASYIEKEEGLYTFVVKD